MQEKKTEKEEEKPKFALGNERKEQKNDQERKGYKLAQFDHKKVKLDSAVGVIGKRRYGKTIWAQWLLSNIWQYFPGGAYVFTKTKHNRFWDQHVPASRIYPKFEPSVVEGIISAQKRKIDEFVKTGVYKESPFVVIILDDVASDVSLKYQELLIDLLFGGRHYKLFVIITEQDIKALGPNVRGNFDLIALTYQTQARTIEAIQQDFASFVPDKNLVGKIIQENTQDHGMVIIDQTEARYSIEETFFCDKAPDPKEHKIKFRIGSDKFWKDSGCDWKEQIKDFKKIPDKDREEWGKIAKRQLKKEKEEYKDDPLDPEEYQMDTNQIALAPKEIREKWEMEFRKKKGLEKSNMTTAFETIDSLFSYKPGWMK